MANTNLVSKLGIDFDNLFVRGDNPVPLVTGIRDSTGVDIGSTFLQGDSGMDTGFIATNEKDVGRLFSDGANLVKVRKGSWAWDWAETGNREGILNTAQADLDNYEKNKGNYRTLGLVENIGRVSDRDNEYAHTIYVNCSIFKDIPGARVDAKWVSHNGSFSWRVRRYSDLYIDIAIGAHGISGWPAAFQYYCHIKIFINIPGVLYREYNTKFGVW